jgi:ketose-bisphosphate aldolase
MVDLGIQSMKSLIEKAVACRYAVGYFESWNLESLQGIVDAAEQTESPVILGCNGDFLSGEERLLSESLSCHAAMIMAAARSARAPCALVFNECSREDWLKEAVDLGFTLVMPVEPTDDYEAYVKLARTVVDFAHRRGALVEVELGRLPCDLPNAVHHGHASTTDPEQAARLIDETGADLLAVSVGNVHLDVRGRRHCLDLDLLERIRRATPVPLVLHGGSGISPDSLRSAIELGVVKVNYATYMKQRYLSAVRNRLARQCEDPHRLLGLGGEEDLMVAGRKAVKEAVLERIVLLGCCGQAEAAGGSVGSLDRAGGEIHV